MLNTAGLSLQQAPPISIPFRFFLTAPMFGMAAGVVLLVFADIGLSSRWLPPTLAATHLLTLGFLTMVMCGAMLQILPVMAGSPVPRVVQVGALTHILLCLGTILMVFAFLMGKALLMVAAVSCLGLGFTVFMVATAIALFGVRIPSAPVTGIKLALAALFMTVLLGTFASLAYVGTGSIDRLRLLADLHLTWGLVGWVGLLLMSVSFQLIPMFQVTPEYPGWYSRWMPRGVFFLLLTWLLTSWVDNDGGNMGLPGSLLLTAVVASLAFFALMTLHLQRRRKRQIVDTTLLFWRVGMLGLIGCALLWCAARLSPALESSSEYPLLLGLGLILGVGFPLVNGMLYKIVPFLSWFHLQNRQLATMCLTVSIPHMKELVSDRAGNRQFYSYLAALLLSLAAVWHPQWLARPAGLLLLLTNLLLLINLVAAVRRFRATYRRLSPEPPTRRETAKS